MRRTSVFTTSGRICVALLVLFVSAFSLVGQEAIFFALQGPGQGSVAIDRAKQTAYVTDLGKAGDGKKASIDGIPLLDKLAELQIRRLVLTCSHPHSDHAGGIRALLENPRGFFLDEQMTKPRFDSITIIDDSATDSLFFILQKSLGEQTPIKIAYVNARNRNAFAGISAKNDAVFIENIPYVSDAKSGPHGNSVVTHLVLGGKSSIVDFDDANSSVIRKTVDALRSKGFTSIDSFVVPHHGSAYHDIEPIFSLGPKTAIITVNPRNPYGHPGPAILLFLMDKLGPENVFFTGSAENVLLNPDGVERARYSAADEESYKLFVEPSYTKARLHKNQRDLELFEKLKSRMSAKLDTSAIARADADELRVALDAASQSNEDLLAQGDRLALSAAAAPTAKQLLETTTEQQAKRLERLMAYLPSTDGETTQLADTRLELARLFRQIEREPPSEIPTRPADALSDDPILRGLINNVLKGLQQLSSSSTTSGEASRVVSDVKYVATLNSARAGTPEIRDWSSTAMVVEPQLNVPYNEVVSPKTSDLRPKGIAIGNTAKLAPGTDFSDYVLTYDLSRKEVVLIGPKNSRLTYSETVDPQVLKALYRFAATDRNSAISLSMSRVKGIERIVRLDPIFVDTQVGLDLLASDLIGWRLSWTSLPDRRPNPYASEFAKRLSLVDACINSTAGATLIDGPTLVGRDGNAVVLHGGVRQEYLSDVPAGITCPQTTCKNTAAGIKVCHLSGLEKFVAANAAQIRLTFPQLTRVDEYAQLIGFLRWARRPGNLAAVDMSSLANVPASNTKFRTPDALTGNPQLR
jgi:beta-lactamase superfamily II metal-dependent hydrolase